jgi:hypothetical protein
MPTFLDYISATIRFSKWSVLCSHRFRLFIVFLLSILKLIIYVDLINYTELNLEKDDVWFRLWPSEL